MAFVASHVAVLAGERKATVGVVVEFEIFERGNLMAVSAHALSVNKLFVVVVGVACLTLT